jgi:hypothetical protein
MDSTGLTKEELISECEKYKNFYWSLFNKTKDNCEFYKDIIKEKELEILSLKRKLSIYNVKVYRGKIIQISQDNNNGCIMCPEFENNIPFHKNNCKDFILRRRDMLEKEVTFNLDFIYGKFQATNIKNNDEISGVTDNFKILEDFLESPEIFDNIKYEIDEKSCDKYKINPIFENCNIWYMNGYNTKYMDRVLNIWEHLIDNNFVYTWCGLRKDRITSLNEKLPEKVLKGDKIAWYFPQRGYVSILEVKGKPRLPTDDELSIIKPTFNEKTIKDMKLSFKNYNWCVLVIPVKFLSYIDKYNCITKKDIQWNDNYVWSSGLRGSSAIKPTPENWKEQVSRMYDRMPYKN